MRSFRGAAPGTTLTVTIALTILLIGVAQYLFQATGQQPPPDYLFGDRSVTIAGARLLWDEVAFLVLAVAVAVCLRYLLRAHRPGIPIRAVVAGADPAALPRPPP